MAVHHFTAPDLITQPDGAWQQMDTFPKDGTIVEVTDQSGFRCKAQWVSDRFLAGNLSMTNPSGWRPLE